MTVYQRPDSNLPEEVENEIIAWDWHMNKKILISFAMIEATLDGIAGFPFLSRLIAWAGVILRAFNSN